MTYGQTAARVAQNKEKRPELYCPAKRCLWRTGGGLCPRHAHLAPASVPSWEWSGSPCVNCKRPNPRQDSIYCSDACKQAFLDFSEENN